MELKKDFTKEDARWILDNYDLVGNPALEYRLKQIAIREKFPKSLAEWRFYFKNAPEGADVGTAAIELLNDLTKEPFIPSGPQPPKSRTKELFLYRCDRCQTVKAFDAKVPNGTLTSCGCANYGIPHSFVAIDFAKKIFFTETT